MKDHLQSQLGAVENLQYQLTSQELQFAQRMALKEQQAAEHVKITVASSSSDSNDGECSFFLSMLCDFESIFSFFL